MAIPVFAGTAVSYVRVVVITKKNLTQVHSLVVYSYYMLVSRNYIVHLPVEEPQIAVGVPVVPVFVPVGRPKNWPQRLVGSFQCTHRAPARIITLESTPGHRWVGSRLHSNQANKQEYTAVFRLATCAVILEQERLALRGTTTTVGLSCPARPGTALL